MGKIKIFACQPSYASGKPASHRQFWQNSNKYQVTKVTGGFSLLACMFNRFWTHALNMEESFAYFVMLHDDIVPEDGWLDILIDEILEQNVDILSVVVPLKNQFGITSTAIDDPEDEFSIKKRITMTEVYQLPETFSAIDCGYPDDMLLVNTGCWACDFTKDWRFKVCFQVRDRIRQVDGKWINEVIPEDWDFSRQVQRLGGKVLCTRKVRLDHIGEIPFSNKEPWGV